jgi:phage gpG-like protein
MSNLIQIKLDGNALAVLPRLANFGRQVIEEVRAEMDVQNELTVGHIKEQRATGIGPFPVADGKLGVRTGRYRRSIRRTKARVLGNTIVSSIGSNVAYAGAHEFGFNAVVDVRGHVRTVASRNVRGVIDGKRKKIAQGIGTVSAHQRRMNIPARMPIRRGIEDRTAEYSAAISQRVVGLFQRLVQEGRI